MRYWAGNITESLIVSRPNLKQAFSGGRRWGNPPECTVDLGCKRLSKLKGRDLPMLYSMERDLVVPTSSGWTGHEMVRHS